MNLPTSVLRYVSQRPRNGSERGVRDREVVPDRKLGIGREQILDLRERRNEGIHLAAEEERFRGQEELGRDRVDEEARARALDGVFREQTRNWGTGPLRTRAG